MLMMPAKPGEHDVQYGLTESVEETERFTREHGVPCR